LVINIVLFFVVLTLFAGIFANAGSNTSPIAAVSLTPDELRLYKMSVALHSVNGGALFADHDQLPADKLIMTHDLIANMLGVRREGVSLVAGKLAKKGVIAYARGNITILDRALLEKVGCECYQVVMDEYDRLLGEFIPSSGRKKGKNGAKSVSAI